ncbi:polyketide cyclase [Stenotrophomonas maltophilia]|uniref:polyketide cyclase n=1 Tax=Stenotrophomonas maltophilia TaxID=40324 RepID=UPI0016601967|nr:polyketide cyclase [Stenotrophomonas maltophilia]
MDDVLKEAAPALVMEQRLPAPPERVWRALFDPALRERWLPAADLADPKPCLFEEGRELGFRLRDARPPHLHSLVCFRLRGDEDGGTVLTIVHRLTDRRALIPPASNDDHRTVMRAA